MNECKGMNCGATDGVSHSPECHAEHAATVAGGVFTKSTAQPEPAAPSVAPEPVAWIGPDYFTAFSKQGFQVSQFKIAPGLVPLFTHPPRAPSVAPEPPTREALAEIVRLHLTSTYHCTRVWEAWHVGTMTEDDFEPASESDMAEEIADAILAAHPPRAPLTAAEIDKAISTSRDALLDHIFEHGTTAEGIASRFREVARAIEAAHGISAEGEKT